MKKLILLILLMSSSPTWAGGRAGNGGDGVVCRDANKKILSIELLDFYEARTLRGFTMDLGGPELNYMQKINFVLNRLKASEPYRTYAYGLEAQKFMSQALFSRGITLTDIPDSEHLSLPVNCFIEQVVIQQEVKFPEDKKFLVNQDLWDAMDNNNKAGIMLHEIIYSEALAIGDINSIRTRYFNSYIDSTRMNQKVTPKAMADLLSRVGFDYMGFNEFSVRRSSMDFYENGIVKKASSNGTVTGKPYLWKGQELTINGDLEFYESGELSKVQHGNDLTAKTNMGEEFKLGCYDNFQFWPNGELKGMCRVLDSVPPNPDLNPNILTIRLQNKIVKMGKEHGIEFWDNQAIAEFALAEDTELQLVNGINVKIAATEWRGDRNYVDVDRRGLVLGGTLVDGASLPISRSNRELVKVLPKTEFSLYENGTMKSAFIESLENWPDSSRQKLKVVGQSTFWPSGTLKSAWARTYLKWQLQNQNAILVGYLDFHENGKLQSGYLAYPLSLSDKDGKVDKVSGKICLDKQGYLLDCSKLKGEK